MPKVSEGTLHYQDFELPIDIYLERRRDIRSAFGKKGLIVRFPAGISDSAAAKEMKRVKQWAISQLDKQETLRLRYLPKGYKTGDILLVMGHEFELRLQEDRRRKATATSKVEAGPPMAIEISMPYGTSPTQRHNIIPTLISRSLASFFKKDIVERVQYWNQAYYQEEINGVHLKYMTSRWGSCSTHKNVNLSTRLLLVPEGVRDYVIIHELSHLKEMNHSPRFWSWVAKADPSWKAKEAWLRHHGHLCVF